MFKELSKEKTHVREQEILKKWEKIDILDKTTKGDKNFVFYDGPAFANGFPGIHHMLAKFLKDAICKYQIMQGHKVLRKIGWDTHGLPIENYVEKKLGFNSKKEIEKYGLDKFNAECRKNIKENENEFIRLTKEMGQFIDTDHPYITCTNDYIETEWWILKKFFDEGLFYEGHKILPYCYRCGTGLASHEVAQGYKEIEVQTVIVPMKMKKEDTYFLVWTTTPWTLIANVALCVNPEASYIKVRSKGNSFIVASLLADKVLGDDYEILEKFTGKDLEYIEYEQLIPSLNVSKKAFFVTNDSYVTMEEGTGIVHIAPAFGEDDAKVGRKYDLPYLNPVGDDGCYIDGIWKGMRVFDADVEVIKYLKDNDKLFKKQKMIHNYPHCWRCDTPLLYYSTPSYYVEVTKLKEKIIAANKKINWYPAYVGEKRFANWLDNLNDWAISRTRYWGTPIPLWKCDCGYHDMIGSEKELKEKAIENIDNLDFHRPYIDEVHLKCPKCGSNMTRTPEVLDCWFDSGSMPFAQYHYPFENNDLWKQQYPADFIAEGIDQTRGWFYSLLVLGVFLTGESPYKNVLVNELLLDKYGKKMHKSKGNAIEPFSLMDKYGADAIRFYLPYVSPVWTPIKFDEDGLKEINSKFFSTLKNTYSFFAMYANADKLETKDFAVDQSKYELIDKWLISKYNHLLKYVTESYNEYDLTRVVRSVVDFVNEDLSNWYIRRNRQRFWDSKLTDSKKCVYQVTYDVLVGLCKIIAPIVPFVSDDIYCNLTGNESVHLSSFPLYDERQINEVIEQRMDLVRELISLGRNARENARIKIRQPLNEIILASKNKEIIGDLESLIMEELNLKKVTYALDLTLYVDFTVVPNFKVCGNVLGSNIKEFKDRLATLTNAEAIKLENNQPITLNINGNDIVVTKEMVEIRVKAREGFNASFLNDNFIVLNTSLTKELINEGIVREFISKVQQMRKANGYNIIDRITIFYKSNSEFEEAIKNYFDYIKSETLCTEFIRDDNISNLYDLNGINVDFVIKKN